MSEAPARMFAFDSFAARHVGRAPAVPGVTVETRHAAAMCDLRGSPRNPDFLSEVSAAFGVALPVDPNTAVGTNDARILWLGPDQWLIVTAQPRDLLHDAGITGGTLTDVSHGRAILRLAGPDARHALAKGCPLDLDPRRFAVDRCAQTAIARINVVLDHVAPGVYDLYCPRSYAGSFWHWLTEAAAEYGCRIERTA